METVEGVAAETRIIDKNQSLRPSQLRMQAFGVLPFGGAAIDTRSRGSDEARWPLYRVYRSGLDPISAVVASAASDRDSAAAGASDRRKSGKRSGSDTGTGGACLSSARRAKYLFAGPGRYRRETAAAGHPCHRGELSLLGISRRRSRRGISERAGANHHSGRALLRCDGAA